MLTVTVGPLLTVTVGQVLPLVATLLLVQVHARVDTFRHPQTPIQNADCGPWKRPQLSSEKTLIQGLLQSYLRVGKNGRPVLNVSTIMNVSFGLGLIQMDLDEKYKVLKMSMWSRYTWRDEYLTWKPSDYGGLTEVRLASSLIWLPDIMLYNSADPKAELRDVLAVVKYNGQVHWVPHQIFKSSCSLDVTNFPFDYQNCHMWFGSWTHSATEINVSMVFESGIDLSTFQSDYLESSDWEIEQTEARKDIMPSVNDTPNFGVLKFQLRMKRKLVFSSYILTLPCIFLACLTLVVFWLPPDRPDRTALAMSIFASFLVLLLILVEAVPATASSVPILGVYYCFNLVIIMMSVFLSSLVVNVCRAGEGTRPVPHWLKVMTIDGLGRLLLVSPAGGSVPSPYYGGAAADGGEPTINHNCGAVRRCSEPGLFLPDVWGPDTAHSGLEDGHPAPRDTGCGGERHPAPTDTDGGGERHPTERDSSGGGGRHPAQRDSGGGVGRHPAQLDSGSGGGRHPAQRDSGVDHAAGCHMLEVQMWKMQDALVQIKTSLFEQREADLHTRRVARAWHDVALVLDRFFFIMYIILIIISLVILFPRPK